ncbi:alpha/beta hydrolase [Mucilaginibacter sp. cycad4]|uniref:alpha/beta hydrolase n=1 Tax=Mucilaginibacter sp. cycad4 TaxID=3342096 RepID=UPI002AABB050|nr:alpha/beta hydrolase [Mucilaginibacter gossypii]WPV01698.1 alpha/beta hydrolase [Mucilaginibacter gossypii]
MKTKEPKQTIQDYATDSKLSGQVKDFLKILNNPENPPVESMTKEAARQVLIDAQASVDVDLSGIDETEKQITADGFNIKLNIVRPAGNNEKLPVFIFLHGGGWILGDYQTHKRMVRDIVVLSGFAAVFVNYTPSPEARYPQAINEIYAATRWVAENGHQINVDGNNMAIVGNSVGGNMATVIAMLAKEKKGPQIRLQVMLWPVADAKFDSRSYQKFGTDRFLTSAMMQWMFDQYAPDKEQREEIYISPLNATLEQLQGLPPALLIVAQSDILRDAAQAYAQKLDAAGVPITSVRYNGMIHDFGLLNALASLPQTRSAFYQVATELKRYLKPA